MTDLSKEAKEARAAYAREWRKKNPDKEAAAKKRYWEKKAKKSKTQTAVIDPYGGDEEERSAILAEARAAAHILDDTETPEGD